MGQLHIRTFDERDQTAVVALWQAAGLTRPWNNPELDIERKLAVQRELFLVGECSGEIVASVMAGYDGHRGWMNYLAVLPSCQGQGAGREMVLAIIDRLLAMGCPKVNLQVRGSNLAAMAFYQALGFVEDDCRSFGLRLIADE